MDQIEYYEDKLNYEMDSWDLANTKDENIVIIDARSKEAYEQEHIAGAINFPHRDMNIDSVKTLDTNKLYVTYCDGIGCNASSNAALKLAKLGFKTNELIGGLDWWKRDGYSTDGIDGVKNSGVGCGC